MILKTVHAYYTSSYNCIMMSRQKFLLNQTEIVNTVQYKQILSVINPLWGAVIGNLGNCK